MSFNSIFGSTGSGKGSEILGFLPQPLIPREKCAAPYTNYEVDDSPYKITTSMICAGNFEGQKGGCQVKFNCKKIC